MNPQDKKNLKDAKMTSITGGERYIHVPTHLHLCKHTMTEETL